VVLAAAV
jgi:hypothetical protein